MITPDAKLVVRAPLRASMNYIEKLVRDKNGWITRKIAEISQKPVSRPKEFADGEEFLFLGNRYPLCIRDNRSGGIELREKLYVPLRTGPELERLLTAWYQTQARKIFCERCDAFSKVIGRKPTTIRLSSAQKRWGSCSTSGTVSLSWRLIFAPPEIIDYVIVHEFVHILHHNHSTKFWDTVRSFMPDYQRRRDWLKFHEKMLVL